MSEMRVQEDLVLPDCEDEVLTRPAGGRLGQLPPELLRLVATSLWRRHVAALRVAHRLFGWLPLPGVVSMPACGKTVAIMQGGNSI